MFHGEDEMDLLPFVKLVSSGSSRRTDSSHLPFSMVCRGVECAKLCATSPKYSKIRRPFLYDSAPSIPPAHASSLFYSIYACSGAFLRLCGTAVSATARP